MAQRNVVFQGKSDILFDLDGTLVDSVPDLASAVNVMLTQLEREHFSEEIIRSWVGNGAKTLVERALSGQRDIASDLDADYAAKALAIFLDAYQQHACVDTVLYPNVKKTLAELKQGGYQLHIVTNKPLVFVAPILENLGIDSYFKHVLGADSLAEKKPHPMPLLHIANEQKVSLESCVMVGDSHNDVLAANAAPMDSVGLTYGYNYGENIGLHQPTAIFDHFEQLLDILPPVKNVS
ncbi:phosphoglycolate phosphatase [Psychrobium sp. MM17-31]|uniref:phosphoglycolate phosphatase n=1 Tax=Psychrobium sp. MM17-31 TaxID=2917758 RepID=UPI001EF58F32|nr:phosphoglycolate phosphatase [Psychrobium sp. MM17-31]MCG7531122.1 phosphoglycolate phosphatase [Psychrobium sp. MM17-31]